MAAIDLTAGPDISDVARKLKELREAAQMTVSGVAGDVTAAKVLLDTLAKHVQQAQSEIGTDQAWVQQLRTQAGEVQEALSMAPAHLSTNALQGEIDRINAALTEELGLLEQNQQKLQGYNEQLAHSQRVLSGSQSGLQAWKQTLNEPAGNLLQDVAGGLTVCQGALKLVAADSEKLVKIQARLQAVREVVQGLSELSDSVYTTLSARLTVLAKVTDLWHAANLRVGKSLVSMGVAAHTALQQRAQAVAAMDLASEKYKQAIQKMVEAENISNVADMKKTTKWNGKSQEVWSVSGFTDEQNKELNKRVRKARDHEETKIEKEGGANLSERQRRIYAAENNAAGTYIREIKKSLADAQMELETEAGKIISFGINKNAAADKVLQTAGISTPAETQVAENARRDAEQCARAEADVQQQLTQQLQEIHKQSVDATISEEDRRIAEIKTRYAKLREEVDKMLAAGSIDSSQSKTLNAQIDVAEQQEILNQLLDGIKTYEQQRSEIQEKYQEKRKSLYKDDGETLKEGVTQGNVEETNYQEEEALAALDETFAQREASYQAWMEQIATWSLDTLKQTLERAEQELQTLEESGTGNSKQLSSARAKVRTLKKQVEKEDSKTAGDSAASDNGVKNWQKLGKTLTSVGSSFHEIGEAIGGTAGEVLSLAGTIASTTASIIDGIETLVNGTVEGVKTTTITASASIQAMETASVILAIISAALKIAMAIAKFVQRESAATKHYEELKAKYETLVDVWDDLIERKQRYID
ncbi:MAG: hypothetical protein K2I32_03505, partial [Alistipes sp.]|nr:hypothetical protein [Alistipes sp.]